MNALELAECIELEPGGNGDLSVSLMLRKQDAAIKQLREALDDIAAYYKNSWAADRAVRVLKDTEEI